MSLSFIEQIHHDFNESHLKYYSILLNFDNVWDFAAAKAPKIGTKVQQKGRTITCDPAKTYPCGASCRSQSKDCKSPIKGQAKNYAGFLEAQGKKEGKIKPVDTNKSIDISKLSDSEIENSIDDANPDVFKGTVEVDWGSSRGQGKRSGGMVKGSMSAAPKGKKTYTDKYQKLKLNSDEESEIKGSVDAGDNDETAYLKSRSAGFSHKAAMLTSMTDEEITRNNLTRKDIYKLARDADKGKPTGEKKPDLKIVEPTKPLEVVKPDLKDLKDLKDLSEQWLKIDSRKREDIERKNDVNWGDVKAGDRYFDLDSRQYVTIEKKFNKHANATTEDGKKIKVLSYLTQKQSFEDMATDALIGLKKPDVKPVDSVAKTKEDYAAQKVKELQKPIEQKLSKLSKSLEDSEFERIKGTKEQPRRSDIVERYPRTDEQKSLVGQLGIARKELSKVESNENQLKLQADFDKLNTKKPDLRVVEPTKKPQEQTDTKKPDLKAVDGGKGVEPKSNYPISKETADKEPWKLSPSQYGYASGVDMTKEGIGGVSPTQLAKMSDRQVNQYLKDRADKDLPKQQIYEEWKEKVWQAYKDGKFDPKTLQRPKDSAWDEQSAASVVFQREEAENKASRDSRLKKANFENDITHASVDVGDKAWDISGRKYVTVVKKLKDRVKTIDEDGNTENISTKYGLQWKSLNDLKKAVDSGESIKPSKPKDFSEFTWSRENIEFYKNFKTPCNQALSYR